MRSDTRSRKDRLARALYRLKYKEAEELLQQVLQEQEKTPSQEHSDTLWSKYSLERTLYQLEKYEEAEKVFQQALQICEKTPGRKHSDSLWTKFCKICLERLLNQHMRHEEAEKLASPPSTQWRTNAAKIQSVSTLCLNINDGLAKYIPKGNESQSLYKDAHIFSTSSLLRHAHVIFLRVLVEVAILFGNLKKLEDYYYAAGSYFESVGRLYGKSNYAEWKIAIEATFRAQRIWYILEHDGHLATSKYRFDNEVARRFILRHIPFHEANRLKKSQLAAEAWKQLKHDIKLCPCCNELRSNTNNHSVILSELKETADGGCQNCQCILDGINAFYSIYSNDSVTLRLSVRQSTLMGLSRLVTEVKPAEGDQLNIYVDRECMISTAGTSQILEKRFAENTGPVPVKVIRTPAESDQEPALGRAASWLQDCVTTHSTCTILDTDFMPDRLVNVGKFDSEPFLVEGVSGTAPYAALSYCWGTVPGTLITKKENLEQHKKSIRLVDMPQTLRDAVLVCRTLKIQYLWVDALCIIQSDYNEIDWYEQSGKMRQIYSNCLVCLSADVADGCTEGFLGIHIGNLNWNNSSAGTETILQFPKVGYESIQIMQNTISRQPLSKRGWALQESILPIRVLHFTDRGLVWECNSKCQSEYGVAHHDFWKPKTNAVLSRRGKLVQGVPVTGFAQATQGEDWEGYDLRQFLATRTADAIFWAWEHLVTIYSQRSLTKQGDKLAALSGLAQTVADALQGNAGSYLAGLWEGNLVKSLLWYVAGPELPWRPSIYRAPSWSWASVEGPIGYFNEHFQFPFETTCRVTEAKCESFSYDRTGKVTSGYMIVDGPLAQVTLVVYESEPPQSTTQFSGTSGNAGRVYKDCFSFVRTTNSKSQFEVLLDEHMGVGYYDSGYYCLEVGKSHDMRPPVQLTDYYGGRGGARTWWLVLKREARSQGTHVYKRVGIGYRNSRDAFYNVGIFRNADYQTITVE